MPRRSRHHLTTSKPYVGIPNTWDIIIIHPCSDHRNPMRPYVTPWFVPAVDPVRVCALTDSAMNPCAIATATQSICSHLTPHSQRYGRSRMTLKSEASPFTTSNRASGARKHHH